MGASAIWGFGLFILRPPQARALRIADQSLSVQDLATEGPILKKIAVLSCVLANRERELTGEVHVSPPPRRRGDLQEG